MDESGLTWFQYQKDLDLPVYIRIDLKQFTPGVIGFLTQMRFQELSKKESEQAAAQVNNKGGRGRVLLVEQANAAVAKQIDMIGEHDRYGPESLVQGRGYSIYRYKEVAVMAWSYQMVRWQLGCFGDFGSEGQAFACQVIINRFLSYALAPLGIAGLWGTSMGGGITLLKPRESQGQAIFIDAVKKKVISVDGVKDMGSRFKVFRINAGQAGRMGIEELLSALFAHTTYLDYGGPTVPVRQVLQTLSKLAEGVNQPMDAANARPDLSL